MNLTQQLVTVARAYGEAKKLSLARISTIVLNDGKKLSQIENDGVDLTTGRFESAMRWFSTNWPERTRWPRGIPRPVAAVNEAAE